MSTDTIRTFSQFVALLEDGHLHERLTAELAHVNAEMNNHVLHYGGKAKASITLRMDFALEGGAFEIVATHKTTLPKPRAVRSIMWGTPQNEFSRANPKQIQMWGPGGNVIEGPAASRTV